MLSRRHLLKMAASIPWMGVASGAEGLVAEAATAPATARRRGRPNLVFVYLPGGVDAVLTTNPRTRNEVENDVDIPYAPDAIRTAGNLRLGPSLAALAPYASDMVVLNGVAVNTAGHVPGMDQLVRCKLGYNGNLPALVDIIGGARQGEALRSIAFGSDYVSSFMGSCFAADVLVPRLLSLSPDERHLVARTMRANARGLRDGSAAGAVAASNAEDAASLIDRFETLPRFEPAIWSPDSNVQPLAVNLQTTRWFFENELTRTAVLAWGYFDTHHDNMNRQTRACATVFSALARFVADLKTPRPDGTSLFDDTLIVVASELGRYPRLNAQAGKDHFPEIPMILLGGPLKGVGAQAFGSTGRNLEALPVSLKTGQGSASDTSRLSLDDVGTTLLRLSGIEPRTYGYHGNDLAFLGLT